MKKVLAGIGVLVLVSAGGAYYKMKTAVPAYTVKRVIDGDTFETAEKQLIRLADVDAPELVYCGGNEAKNELEKLVLNKPVYLKVVYRDKYMRLLSYVYTPAAFINERMVMTGNAIFRTDQKTNSLSKFLADAQKYAEDKKLGVFGDKCTRVTNNIDAKCNIKGNLREGKNTKIYSLPGCESYARTKVQLYLGDMWFCTEEEAKKAGFVKAGGCPK